MEPRDKCGKYCEFFKTLTFRKELDAGTGETFGVISAEKYSPCLTCLHSSECIGLIHSVVAMDKLQRAFNDRFVSKSLDN